MLLSLQNISKSFGGLSALSNLSFSIDKDEIVGLIGPNGAGKTTAINVITGVYKPDMGTLILRGKEIKTLKPHTIARMGIARTFQITSLFFELTVYENVIAATHIMKETGLFEAIVKTSRRKSEDRNTQQRVEQLLNFVNLKEKSKHLAKNLSYGHQRYLGIAIALAFDPKIILLDEPLAGMSTVEISTMMNLIKKIQNMGISILLVEHNVRAVMDICDRVIVINYGKKIGEGLPIDVLKNQDVIEAYLGSGYAT